MSSLIVLFFLRSFLHGTICICNLILSHDQHKKVFCIEQYNTIQSLFFILQFLLLFLLNWNEMMFMTIESRICICQIFIHLFVATMVFWNFSYIKFYQHCKSILLFKWGFLILSIFLRSTTCIVVFAYFDAQYYPFQRIMHFLTNMNDKRISVSQILDLKYDSTMKTKQDTCFSTWIPVSYHCTMLLFFNVIFYRFPFILSYWWLREHLFYLYYFLFFKHDFVPCRMEDLLSLFYTMKTDI